MAGSNIQTPNIVGNFTRFAAGSGAANGDVIFTVNDSSRFDSFTLGSDAGSMVVLVSLDGTNFYAAALSLIDLGATTVAPVTATAASRAYAFYGNYASIKVEQTGGTAVTNATLLMTKKGGQY